MIVSNDRKENPAPSDFEMSKRMTKGENCKMKEGYKHLQGSSLFQNDRKRKRRGSQGMADALIFSNHDSYSSRHLTEPPSFRS